MQELYRQQNQPEGVTPLALTGERTLPDVPEENYWYRRHQVVYEWIAKRLPGKTVIDMASGEGYGAEILSRYADSTIGVEANPEAFEHAVQRYTSPKLRFERDLVQTFSAPCDAITFLQTIEHIEEVDELLDHFAGQVREGGEVYISTPNVLTLAPKGQDRSGNPWHVYEYRPEEFRALLAPHFKSIEILGLFHARKLRVHELALKAGWDQIHKGLKITKPFYDWFTPAIAASDFKLAYGPLDKALDLIAVCRNG